jgi:hypothetical protein
MKLRINFYNRVYRLCRPVIGNRAAIFVAEAMPVLLFAGIPLLAFWLFLAGPTSRGGGDHQTCGSGPFAWDC